MFGYDIAIVALAQAMLAQQEVERERDKHEQVRQPEPLPQVRNLVGVTDVDFQEVPR